MALETSQVNLLVAVLIEPFSLSQISVFYQKTETSLELYRAKEMFSDYPGHKILEI